MKRLAGRHYLVVGTGRLGLALGSELLTSGAASRVSYCGHSETSEPHPLLSLPGVEYHPGELPPDLHPEAVLITVPDGRIRSVAERLAHSGLPQVPVLHTSGVLGPEPLEPLQQRHFPVGSLHPLVSIADPARDAHKLHGAWYGVEGMPAALEVARAIVDALHGRLIRIDPRGKPLYHAAAVFASNYAVALLAVAERVMREAGVEPELARDALTGLAAGAVQNVAAAGPVDALTGPIARGDDETVSLHLARLSGEDRPLYSVLARETLLLARARGLSPEAATRIADLIQGEQQ